MARTNAPAFTLQAGSHAAEALVVTSFWGTESLSRLYDFRVEFFEKDAQPLELPELLGAQVLLTVHVGKAPLRHVHGLVRQAEALGRIGGRWRYRVQVAPKLERLRHIRKSRIFQAQSVPDIVKAVLGEGGVEHRVALNGSYEAHEYCAQYRESDFDFISRLLEAEGIFYFFEHSEGGHTLVLGDGEGAHTALPGGATLPLREADKRAYNEEFISRMERVHRLRPGAVVLRDFDFKKPALDLSAQGGSAEGLPELELYDYPGEYVAPGVGKAVAMVRMEEKAQGAQTCTGHSACPRMAPGYLFEPEDPGHGTFSGQYLLEEVVHSGQQPDTLGNAETLGGVYWNGFRCMPKGVPFRPPRVTPRPLIPGLQTAMVVGAAGEEIHTDQHGRIKVQFHWDREGQRDDRASCWVRVGQAWGGLAWGALFLPRIGQEVLVRFLEGNPDRPLIAGAVYNGENPVPYELPGKKTKSTLKSASSLGSNGFNELRLEDAAGREEIFAHAQKDEDLLTENDKDQQVGGFDDLLVKKDRKRTVDGHQKLRVKKDDARLIEGSQTLLVQGNRDTTTLGSHDETVEGNQTISVSKCFTLEVTQAAAETVGAAKATTIGGAYAVSVALAMSEAVGGAKAVEIGAAYTENVIGSRQESVTDKSERKVGGDFQSEVKGAMTVAVGADLKESVGAVFQLGLKEAASLLAKTFSLKSDKFSVVVNGNLALQIEKSGNVKLFAKTLTWDGSDVKVNGGKVKLEASGSEQGESIQLKEIGKLQPAEAGSVKFQVRSRSSKSVAGLEYELKLPDGSVRKGKLDDSGQVQIDKVPDGECVLSFSKS